MLCHYSDLLGEPGEGIHQYRLFDIAILDVLLTFIVAFILSKTEVLHKYRYIYILIGLFILGILLHRLFCVKTTLDQLIFE